MVEIGIGVVDRTVDRLAVGMEYLVELEPASIGGRTSRVFRWGVECEGDEFTFVPLDTTRSVVITRTFDCNDDASYEAQEAVYSEILDTLVFRTPYESQATSTMEVTILLCEKEAMHGDAPTVSVRRTVPKSTAVADATLRALMDVGYVDEASTCNSAGSTLAEAYRGVTIANGVATVSFSQSFKEMFGDDEMLSESAQRSMTANLKQFPSVTDVRYVVQP